MPIDVSSPGFVVQVLAASSAGRFSGRPDPSGAPGKILDSMTDVSIFVESFEVEQQDRAFGKLKLVVDNWDLHFFEHPAWQVGNLVRAFWGYPGKIQGPRYFVVDNRRGGTRLSIECVEQAAISNEEVSRLWTNTTRAQIVAKLVSENAFGGVTKIDIDDAVALRLQAAGSSTDPATKAALNAEVEQTAADFASLDQEKPRDFTQAKQTNWQFAKRLAEDVGFEVYVEDNVLHFHPRRLGAIPVRKYEWFTGTGDLLEWNIEEWRALDRAGVIEAVGRDPISRENLSATGSNANTKRDTLGNQGSVAQKTISRVNKTGKLVVGTKVVPTPRTDTAAVQNVADSGFRLAEQDEVKMTATVIGDPELKAGQIIELAGISRPLSGNYYVSQVFHKIEAGIGYQTSLTLVRNATTSLPTTTPPDLDATKAKDNAQDLSRDPRQKIVRDPITGVLAQTPRTR